MLKLIYYCHNFEKNSIAPVFYVFASINTFSLDIILDKTISFRRLNC